MNFIIISIIEIIYLIYFFNFFRTKYSFNHPLEFIITSKLSNYFKHPISSDIYENKICSFGNFGSILISIYFLIRIILYLYYKKLFNRLLKYNKYLFLIIFVICFMNLNAVIYFFSHFCL